MCTQAQMGQHASQGALALGAGVRAAALVLDGRAQGWGNGAPVFDSSRNCSSAFGRSLFISHARGFPSGQRIGRLSLAASAPGRHLSRRDTSLAGNLGSSARALPHFLFRSPDHVGCNRSEQAKNHVVGPFKTSPYAPNVATGGTNDVQKFRERGSSDDH